MSEYDDPSRSSRHALAEGDNPGTLVCSSCHDVHSAAASDTVKGLISSRGKKSGNEFCYSCHGASAGSVPGGDLRGFQDSAHNAGVVAPPTGTKVVCLSCHVAHSTREAALDPYSGDDRCLRCHQAGAFSDTSVDILQRLSGPGPDTRHDLLAADSSATGSRLACENCHEPHTASVTTPCVDPYNPSTTGGMSAAGNAFCLKCHSGALPRSTDTSPWAAAPLAAGGATNTVDIAAAWATNFHSGGSVSTTAGANLRPGMGFSAGDTLVCGDCHDPHGSPNRFTLLDTVRAKTGTMTADALLVVPVGGGGVDLRFFCSSCHDLSASTHPGPAQGGADLSVYPLDCTASGCHRHVGNGL